MTPGPLAAVVFYRSHLLSDDIAPITDLLAALRARGLAVGAIFVASLKAPDTAAYVARTLAAWQPAVVLNATGFSARMEDASPLDAPDVPVLQLSWPAPAGPPGMRPAADWRRRTWRCRWCCRNWTGGC